MESVFDIINEAKRDEAIERFKRRTLMHTERDVHIAFEVYGRDAVIEMITKDKIAFVLDDRIITQDTCQDDVSKKDDIALLCMFHGEDAMGFLKDEVTRAVDQLIADYEVQL